MELFRDHTILLRSALASMHGQMLLNASSYFLEFVKRRLTVIQELLSQKPSILLQIIFTDKYSKLHAFISHICLTQHTN